MQQILGGLQLMSLKPIEVSALKETFQQSERLTYQVKEALQILCILHEMCISSGVDQVDTGSKILSHMIRLEEGLKMASEHAEHVEHTLRILEEYCCELQAVYGPPPSDN